jgi:ATP-dependent helicase HrpB
VPIPLPIDSVLPALLAALREGPCVVLEAPPGAGKTTRVPPAMLDAGYAGKGEIVVLEPRRLAARLSARRVAEERHELHGGKVGEEVGYTVRFDDVSSARTKLRYVTEGVLARRLLDDPLLRGVGAVVLDEFHERHLQSDLALACLLRLVRSGERPDLKLVVMSATLDAAPLAEHLDAPVVRSEGRRFPVEVTHLEQPDDRRLDEQVAAAVRRLTAPDSVTKGDLLVFLPGAAEIRWAQEKCAELAQHRNLALLPLHGDLAPDEQDRVLARWQQRKVILATNVAETSVTIDGVTGVIDSGLARIAGHSPWTGLPTLSVGKVAQSSAEQRAGRAGRTAPGVALRLYTKHDLASRPAHLAPEVQRLDLAETALELLAQGLQPRALPWLDEPDEAALQAAEALLTKLGFVTSQGGRFAITPAGRQAVRFPLHPRLSRLVLEAHKRGASEEGCGVAAILGERDLRSREGRDTAGPTGNSDLLELWDLLREARNAQFDQRRLRGLGLDSGAARRADKGRQQLTRLLPREGPQKALGIREREEALRISLLCAFPDRVAKRRSKGGSELLLCGGGAVQLGPSSVVRDAELLVAVDIEERRELRPFAGAGAQKRSGAIVRLASAIEPEWLLDLFSDDLTENVELEWQPARARVEALSRMRYQELVLEESRRLPNLSDEKEAAQAAKLLVQAARAAQGAGTAEFVSKEALAGLQARLQLIAANVPDAGLSAPDAAAVDAALEELCQGSIALADLRSGDLLAVLVRRAGPQAEAQLAKLCPESVLLPGGRRVTINYVAGQPPWIESRLQDFFGMARGPAVCNGRVFLVCHLTAPNGRAQQVTQDLAGFWVRHYPAVRKELMRKYPRHPWPEDGASAVPPPPKPPRR